MTKAELVEWKPELTERLKDVPDCAEVEFDYMGTVLEKPILNEKTGEFTQVIHLPYALKWIQMTFTVDKGC
jgi:hypothetical protein